MDNQNQKISLVRSSFWSFFVSLFNRAGALILVIIFARNLLPTRYGEYSIVLSMAMIFLTFADMGINLGFIRYLSYSLKKSKKYSKAYFIYFNNLKFTITLFFSFLLFILAYPISYNIYHNSSLFIPLIFSAIFVFISSLDSYYANIFIVAEKVKYGSYREALNQILKIVFVVFIFSLLSSEHYIGGIFVSFALASLITLIYSYYYSKKFVLPAIKQYPSNIRIDKKRILKYLFFLTISSIFLVLFSYIDSIILGLYIQSDYVGFYRAAFSIVNAIALFIISPALIFVPFFSTTNKRKVSLVLNTLLKYFSLITIPSAIGLFLVGKYFIRTLFGYSFLESAQILYVLALLIPFLSYCSLFYYFLSAKEKTKQYAMINIKAGILNILLTFIFVKLMLSFSPIMAAKGAALAAVFSYLFIFFLYVKVIKREFKINLEYHFIKPLISAMVMYIIVNQIFAKSLDVNLWNGLYAVIIGIISYFSIVILLKGISKEDFELVKLFFART